MSPWRSAGSSTEMTYESGSSDVTGSPRRLGGPQAYVRLLPSWWRAAVGGIAAATSGYVLPKKDAEIGETVDAEPHAWVQCSTTAGSALTDQRRPLGELHVIVGTAREYGDSPASDVPDRRPRSSSSRCVFTPGVGRQKPRRRSPLKGSDGGLLSDGQDLNLHPTPPVVRHQPLRTVRGDCSLANGAKLTTPGLVALIGR